MQKKFYHIIDTHFAGTVCLGDLFIINIGKKDSNDFFVEPLPYYVDIFYLDSLPKRNVITININ